MDNRKWKTCWSVNTYGVLRGGGFFTESGTTAVGQRDGLNRDIYSAVNVSFRVVLYLK